jgi:hypothetical protein
LAGVPPFGEIISMGRYDILNVKHVDIGIERDAGDSQVLTRIKESRFNSGKTLIARVKASYRRVANQHLMYPISVDTLRA